MVELTEYAKNVIRSKPDQVRGMMRRQGLTEDEIDNRLAECGVPEAGGSLASQLDSFARRDNGTRGTN